MVAISKSRRMGRAGFHELVIQLGLMDELRSAKTVVVKPNLTNAPAISPTSGSHVFSDMRLVQDIVEGILELSPAATIRIAESDSSGDSHAYEKFARFGLPGSLALNEIHTERVDVLDLTRDQLVVVRNERFKYFVGGDRQLWLSETLVGADFVVSLSNCKTHVLTGFTGACKNLFGCLPAFDKSIYHPDIHEVIHDVTLAVSPRLNVVDAFCAMEGNGPVFGRDVDCGYRVFSADATEADLCACQCAGIEPTKIKHLEYLTKTTKSSEVQTTYPVIVPLAGPSKVAHMFAAVGLLVESVGCRTRRYGLRVEGRRRIR